MGTAVTQLLEPVLTGVRTPYFFNGRTLTAEDLRAWQEAVTTRQQQLGQAVGEGIVTGFEVALDPKAHWARPAVSIRKGLAVNQRGDTVALMGDINLDLVAAAAARGAQEGEFEVCDQAAVTLTNLGLYVLVVLPASGLEGRVPMTSVGMEGISGLCGSKYAVSGVRFRLVRVPVPVNPSPGSLAAKVTNLATELEVLIGQLPAPDKAQPPAQAAEAFRKVSLFRNGAAYLCFPTDALRRFPEDPLDRIDTPASTSPPSLLDALRASGAMSACDVPLALVYWTSQGVKFVDQWAVRRMIHTSGETVPPARWLPGHEALRQFQDHLASLMKGNDFGIQPASVGCESYFHRLPPVGVLTPVAAYGLAGFNQSVFFQGRTTRGPAFIEGALLPSLFGAAFRLPTIDLGLHEMLWLYVVRENRQPYDIGAPTPPVPYLLFVNGQAENFGVPRFDLNYWNYAHFG
jgi:hypothetical protein